MFTSLVSFKLYHFKEFITITIASNNNNVTALVMLYLVMLPIVQKI